MDQIETFCGVKSSNHDLDAEFPTSDWCPDCYRDVGTFESNEPRPTMGSTLSSTYQAVVSCEAAAVVAARLNNSIEGGLD